MKRAVIIVPNESLEAPVFIRDVSDNSFHVLEIKNFCDKYNIGVTYESLGIFDGDVHGLSFHYALASLGHIVITFGEMLLLFLPEYLDNHQLSWLRNNALFFKKNRQILEYAVVNEKEDLLSSGNYKEFKETILEIKKERKLNL